MTGVIRHQGHAGKKNIHIVSYIVNISRVDTSPLFYQWRRVKEYRLHNYCHFNIKFSYHTFS